MKPKHITRSKAKALLKNLGEDLDYFKPIIDKDSFCNPCTFANKYVIRQVNTNWPNKAEAEACAINFARKMGIPSPEIIYWDKNYIIYKKIEGKNLSKIWKGLDKTEKRKYMKQTITYLEKMQTRTFKKIGSIYEKGIGKNVDTQKGPYENFDKFLLDEYNRNVKNIKLPIRKKFQVFKKKLIGYNPKIKFVFSHRDLVPKNILVNKGKIVGIIDWEWAGSFPQIYDNYELKEWCDEDLLKKSNLKKNYPNKFIDMVKVTSYAMVFAYYKDWNIPNEKKYLSEEENKLDLILRKNTFQDKGH